MYERTNISIEAKSLPDNLFCKQVTDKLFVYQANLSDMQDFLTIYPANTLLSHAELERGNRGKHTITRQRFIAGRAFMRLILAHHLDRSASSIDILTTPFGKPYQTHQRNLFFNLSGTGNQFALAVSYHADVGIDIETHKARKNMSGMVDTVLTEKEKVLYQQQPDEYKILFFYRAWCLKEATLKADGRGLSLPVNSIGFNSTKPITMTDWNEKLSKSDLWNWYYFAGVDSSLALALASID